MNCTEERQNKTFYRMRRNENHSIGSRQQEVYDKKSAAKPRGSTLPRRKLYEIQ